MPVDIWVKEQQIAEVATKPDQAKVTFSVNESKSHNEFLVVTQHFVNREGIWYAAKSITMPMELAHDAINTLKAFIDKEYT